MGSAIRMLFGAMAAAVLLAAPQARAGEPVTIIEVLPAEHDFGQVTVGETGTLIVSIENINGHILNIWDVSLSADSDAAFAITVSPGFPLALDWNGNSTTEVEVTFAPGQAGYVTGTLVITSDDLVQPVVEVPLGGEGVEDAPDPVTLEGILAFFDAGVEAGTIDGRGCWWRVQKARRKAFRALLVAAGTLIEEGYLGWACFLLERAYVRSDGLPRPPDLVVGEDVPELNGMILQLMADLGCE